MKNFGNTEIILTRDTEKIKLCALMMSQTDPWITLGMDYNKCLKAFDGLCKEIYVIEVEKEIIGFVILQVCGSFAGYIQTICIGAGHRGRARVVRADADPEEVGHASRT